MTNIPRYLWRNAKCPICSKFYHNLDVHNNPVPSRRKKRAEESLCQCVRGIEAREMRKKFRNDREAKIKESEAKATAFMDIGNTRRAFWDNVAQNNKQRKTRVGGEM